MDNWHVVQARAVMAGLVGPGRVERVTDLSPIHFLALVESIVCESEDGAKEMQRMWDAAKPAPPVARGEARREQIAAFRDFGG